MNELTLVGNLTADPCFGCPPTVGASFGSMWPSTAGASTERPPQYDDLPPVFHRVVAFGPVAENAAQTLRKGLEVVAVGQMTDDSYETEAGEKRRQVVLEAHVIAPSLRFAKANVVRVQRDQPAPEPEG